MSAFKKEFGKNSGRGGFGKPRFGGGGDRGGFKKRDRGEGGDREMFPAVCSSCGNKCEVPFKPTGERPVLCRECYAKQSGKGERDNARGSFAPKREFNTRTSFKQESGEEDRSMSALRRELALMNEKLDKIISIMSSASLGATVKKASVKRRKKDPQTSQ